MHSGIVNGYQLLCDAYIVPEQHRGTAALISIYSLLSFSRFSFCVFHYDLSFPNETSVCTHTRHQNDLVLTVLLRRKTDTLVYFEMLILPIFQV